MVSQDNVFEKGFLGNVLDAVPRSCLLSYVLSLKTDTSSEVASNFSRSGIDEPNSSRSSVAQRDTEPRNS